MFKKVLMVLVVLLPCVLWGSDSITSLNEQLERFGISYEDGEGKGTIKIRKKVFSSPPPPLKFPRPITFKDTPMGMTIGWNFNFEDYLEAVKIQFESFKDDIMEMMTDKAFLFSLAGYTLMVVVASVSKKLDPSAFDVFDKTENFIQKFNELRYKIKSERYNLIRATYNNAMAEINSEQQASRHDRVRYYSDPENFFDNMSTQIDNYLGGKTYRKHFLSRLNHHLAQALYDVMTNNQQGEESKALSNQALVMSTFLGITYNKPFQQNEVQIIEGPSVIDLIYNEYVVKLYNVYKNAGANAILDYRFRNFRNNQTQYKPLRDILNDYNISLTSKINIRDLMKILFEKASMDKISSVRIATEKVRELKTSDFKTLKDESGTIDDVFKKVLKIKIERLGGSYLPDEKEKQVILNDF